MENIRALGLEEYFKQLIQMEPQQAIAQITQYLLNLIMLREKDFFLNADDSEENKVNGFYGRNLACMFGNLNLNIPRDRLIIIFLGSGLAI